MSINVLPPELVSQIAAGEVVERPASVIKELVENSLDAGAAAITVELEEGGLRLIRVRDDGRGLPGGELPLALRRHATSKISSLAQLERVATLGFRGEALPSIASVSDLTMTSRTADDAHGWAVSGRGDDAPLKARPAAHPRGTTVEVRELFARIPARRKFLRTPATEFRHAQLGFRRMALSRPDVAFQLLHNGRRVLNLPAASDDGTRRVEGVCGEDFLAHGARVDARAAGLALDGWVATPGFSRSQADMQYAFVNGRMVRDKLINHAVRQAYQDVLHNQRFPAFVLHLSLDPAQVDVNAHPAKAEVRFRQSGLVHDFISRSLHEVLAHGTDSPGHAVQLPVRPPPPADANEYRPATRLFDPVAQGNSAYAFQAPAEPAPGVRDGEQSWPGLPDDQARAEPTGQQAGGLGQAIGQLHGIYILAQNEAGLVLVDMHAAHERILYERLKRRLDDGGLKPQPLLVPVTLRVGQETADLAEEQAVFLRAIGLDVVRRGPAEVGLVGVPAELLDSDVESLLRDVLGDLAVGESGQATGNRVRDRIEHILGNMGCKAAIKAGRRLQLAEMNALLRDMEGTPRAGHCNHGRPSWVQVDVAALDRMFMRGQ